MVKFQDLVKHCVILTTNDCVSDSDKIRKLSAPYHPHSIVCLKDTIYIMFKTEKMANEFVKKQTW
ncbi:MAG: hypothetical protein J6J60_01615 [Clostridia bacterium]|nr:hypothetical protein [Clostridia bacterium]